MVAPSFIFRKSQECLSQSLISVGNKCAKVMSYVCSYWMTSNWAFYSVFLSLSCYIYVQHCPAITGMQRQVLILDCDSVTTIEESVISLAYAHVKGFISINLGTGQFSNRSCSHSRLLRKCRLDWSSVSGLEPLSVFVNFRSLLLLLSVLVWTSKECVSLVEAFADRPYAFA